MVPLNIRNKTGFYGVNPEIYDKRGLFYKKQGNVSFNLPAGNYFTNSHLSRLDYPVKYYYPSLPTKEKAYPIPNPKDVIIKVDPSLRRAKIDINKNLIVIGSDVLSMPTPEICCIFFHELGHYYYSTEEFCDYYAIYCMIKLGFNPSQFVAFVKVLGNTDYSIFRKNFAYRQAQKIKKA